MKEGKMTLDDLTEVNFQAGSDYGQKEVPIYLSLTKRELFAAFACLGHFVLNRACDGNEAEVFAKGAVAMADALIVELGSKKESPK